MLQVVDCIELRLITMPRHDWLVCSSHGGLVANQSGPSQVTSCQLVADVLKIGVSLPLFFIVFAPMCGRFAKHLDNISHQLFEL